MLKQLTVLNSAEKTIAALSNELPGACPIMAFRQRHEAMEGGAYADTCSLMVPSTHTDAQHVADGNYVLFQDADGYWQEYKLMRPQRIEGEQSLIYAEGEHAFYELLGEWIDDIRPTNSSAGAAVTQALNGTRWQLGTAAALGIASVRIYKTSVLAGLTAIAKAWKGELRFRLTVTAGVITGRYVDILTRRGAVTGKRVELRKDLINFTQTIDRSGQYTALVGRGKGVEVEGGSSEEDPAYGRRLEFDEVVWTTPTNPVAKPAGQNWVGDETARLAYGPGGRHIRGSVQFDDETDPAKLLQRTYDALQECKDPRVTYALDALALEELSGMEHEAMRLGDTDNVINNSVTPAITGTARIILIDRDLVDPRDCRVMLGNYIPTTPRSLAALKEQIDAMRDRAGTWDHATAIGVNESGLGELQYQIDLLNTQLLSTVSGISTTPNGALLIETADKTAALMLAGGILGLASSKTGGEYNWRTFATGSGVTADEITTGVLQAAMVKILGSDHFYWDAGNLYILDPEDTNKQIRIGQYDGAHYGIAFTNNGGGSWTIAIGHGGINGTDIDLSSNSTVRIAVGEIGTDNLIINSGRFADAAYWSVSKDADTTITSGPSRLTTPDAAVTSGTVPVIDLKVNTFSSGGWCNLINTSFRSMRFVPGKKYTISGRFYTNAALSDPRISIADTNGANAVLPTTALPGGTGWRDFKITFSAEVAGNLPTLLLWARASGAQLAIQTIKLEVGSTATAWSLSALEASGRIASAEASITVHTADIALRATRTYVDDQDAELSAAAADAQAAADDAADDAADANAKLSDIAADNKLTPSEKKQVREKWDTISAEKAGLNTQASDFGVTTPNTLYNTYFYELATYLNAGTAYTSGVPAWIADANLGTTTTVTGATLRSRFAAYYNARTTLLNAIAANAKARADAAQARAEEAILEVSSASIIAKVGEAGVGNSNMIRNGRCDFGTDFWLTGAATLSLSSSGVLGRQVFRVVATGANGHMYQVTTGLIVGNTYTVSARVSKDAGATSARILTFMNDQWSTRVTKTTNGWEIIKATFVATATSCAIYFNTVGTGYGSGWTDIKFEEGSIATAFCPHPSEFKSSSISITDNNVTIDTQNLNIILRDALNNPALQIDGTSKALKISGTFNGVANTLEISSGQIRSLGNGSQRGTYMRRYNFGEDFNDGNQSWMTYGYQGVDSGGTLRNKLRMQMYQYLGIFEFGGENLGGTPIFFSLYNNQSSLISPSGRQIEFHQNISLRDKGLYDVGVLQFTGSKAAWHEGNLVVARGVTAVTGGQWTDVSFGKTFALLPAVALGTNHTTSFPKVRAVTGTGCQVCLDGTASGNVSWVAISLGAVG